MTPREHSVHVFAPIAIAAPAPGIFWPVIESEGHGAGALVAPGDVIGHVHQVDGAVPVVATVRAIVRSVPNAPGTPVHRHQLLALVEEL